MVSPDGADVYVVGKPSGSGQVVELRRDQSTGAISEIGCVAAGAADGCSAGSGLVGAAGIAVSPDGASVYVASAVSNAVVAFHRDAGTGVLSETGCIAEAATAGCTVAAGLNGATGITVSPDGASVYATSESSSAVVVFARDVATGSLTWHGCVAESAAEGCATAPGLTHAENVVVSPDGANVYVTAFNANAVAEFARNSTTSDISAIGCIAESAADGCQAGNGLNGADGIAVSPSGASVYVAAETSNAIVTFARGGAGGLTEQACTAEAAGDTCTLTRGLNGAARVAVTPDGQSVYAAGFHGNTLTTFSRLATGAIAVQGPCLGQSANSDGCTTTPGLAAPAALGVSPDGHNIYTGAATSNATDSFTRQQPPPTPTGPTAAAPNSIDALGDSFTQALRSGGSCSPSALCPANSWSTGTTASVDSHYNRLVGLDPALSGHAVNRSVSGKMMSYLDTEVKAAITDSPAYVTILMGLNDVCGGKLSVNTMTPTSTFRSEFQTAMNDLTSARPGASVFVASIPNPYHLWQILHSNSAATNAWTAQTVCPAMLANPTSMAAADVSRRATVLQQTVDDNVQLQQVCAEFAHCRFDDNAVFNWAFAPYDIATSDYFHPSLQGQADLATVTYDNGFDFTTSPVPPTVSSGPATALSQSGATLNGSVNPNGADTTYDFQYGTDTTYGQTTSTADAGAGSSSTPESSSLTGLSPATTYHFRIVATNAAGTTSGSDLTFTTAGPAPTATTLPASGVSQTGATLNGTLNPQGQDTTYYFQYGTDTGYGRQTSTQDAGSGTADANVPAALTGLAPGTTYHYQLVATNATATTRGGDQTVKTSAPASSYAQTVLSDSPVSYWRLGEQSGAAAADVQSAHAGTYAGGYTLGAPGAIAADADTAVVLNGTSGYVSVPYSSALNPPRTWSAEAWVDPSGFSTSDDMSAINSRMPTALGHRGYDVGLQGTSGKPYVKIGTGSGYVSVAGPNAVALNAWTYLVATYDGSYVRLYANGALVAGPTKVAYAANTATPLNLGSIANGGGQFLSGGIDEAAVYNTTLSATAVQNHYSAAGAP